jgi:histidine ammonia-lyase
MPRQYDCTIPVILDGSSLDLISTVRAARGDGKGGYPKVVLDDNARALTNECRAYVERHWLSEESPAMYGINTGLGRLCDVRISPADFDAYQLNMINATAAGIGEPFTEEQTRATMVLRVNALSKGCSGIRVECLDRLIDMLNAGVHPIIPSQGSVGASGDLAPLAHLVSVMIGHEQAEAIFCGVRMPAAEALKAAGLPVTFSLGPKDVLGLINGSTVSLGVASLAWDDAMSLVQQADVALALSLEAMRGHLAAFDARIHRARNSKAQEDVAGNVLKLVEGSGRTCDDARRIKLPDEVRVNDVYVPRVQDPYSLRCAPQVHGAARDALNFAKDLLTREANAATDNPLIFPNGAGGYDIMSGGNFHGEPIGYAADLIAVAVAEIGAISERRCYRLTDPGMSFGLPLNLVGGTLGLNYGFGIVHCSAAALASENKVLCFPSVADSIPTKANQEDHVSMCTFSARKAVSVIGNTESILAIEMICAAQGIDLSAPSLPGRSLGKGAKAAFERLRQDVPMTTTDHFQSTDMFKARDLVRGRDIQSAAETAIGGLD